MSAKPQHAQEPVFLTEEIEAELIAKGYVAEPPKHARTQSIRDLVGWRPGETLDKALARKQAATGE